MVNLESFGDENELLHTSKEGKQVTQGEQNFFMKEK